MSEIIQEKKRMLSGIKPSGDLTLGSYLGAVKNWAERADDYDCFYFMADLHAITVRQNPADLRRRTLEQLAQYPAQLCVLVHMTPRRTPCSSRAMCTSTQSWAGYCSAIPCSASSAV